MVTSVRHVGGYLTEAGTQWKDTAHRCVQGKTNARKVAKAWSLGASHGRGRSSAVKLATQLRVVKSTVMPTLTTFGRSRAWARAQVRALQTVQKYALQRAMGLDKMAMHEYHITNLDLHKAAAWEPVRSTLARNTLRWLGHVARVNTNRLPKLACGGGGRTAGRKGATLRNRHPGSRPSYGKQKSMKCTGSDKRKTGSPRSGMRSLGGLIPSEIGQKRRGSSQQWATRPCLALPPATAAQNTTETGMDEASGCCRHIRMPSVWENIRGRT